MLAEIYIYPRQRNYVIALCRNDYTRLNTCCTLREKSLVLHNLLQAVPLPQFTHSPMSFGLCIVLRVLPHQAPKGRRKEGTRGGTSAFRTMGLFLSCFLPHPSNQFPLMGINYTNYFCHPLQMQGLDNCWMSFKVPSIPNHSMILYPIAPERPRGILKLQTQRRYEATANILSLTVLFLHMSTSHSQ